MCGSISGGKDQGLSEMEHEKEKVEKIMQTKIEKVKSEDMELKEENSSLQKKTEALTVLDLQREAQVWIGDASLITRSNNFKKKTKAI